jgi:hypothetical protein
VHPVLLQIALGKAASDSYFIFGAENQIYAAAMYIQSIIQYFIDIAEHSICHRSSLFQAVLMVRRVLHFSIVQSQSTISFKASLHPCLHSSTFWPDNLPY